MTKRYDLGGMTVHHIPVQHPRWFGIGGYSYLAETAVSVLTQLGFAARIAPNTPGSVEVSGDKLTAQKAMRSLTKVPHLGRLQEEVTATVLPTRCPVCGEPLGCLIMDSEYVVESDCGHPFTARINTLTKEVTIDA